MMRTSLRSVSLMLLAATGSSATAAEMLVSAVSFVCDGARTIGADFYPSTVNLRLSDGRNLSLPQAMSGSGALYANAAETFAFWTKGDGAFISESKSGPQTYANCTVVPKS